MAQPDEDLVKFNAVIAHRIVRWWELQSSMVGYDRDTLYLLLESIPGRTVDVPGVGALPDLRPSPQYLRIRAEHRDYGAALVLEVVDTIPASETRNVSLPDTPTESHDDLKLPAGSGIFTDR